MKLLTCCRTPCTGYFLTGSCPSLRVFVSYRNQDPAPGAGEYTLKIVTQFSTSMILLKKAPYHCLRVAPDA
jgi:hypothetical protein